MYNPDAPETPLDLKEVRALAAVVYVSVAVHGYSVDAAVEASLEIAEKLCARSEARELARRDVQERSLSLVRTPGARPRT